MAVNCETSSGRLGTTLVATGFREAMMTITTKAASAEKAMETAFCSTGTHQADVALDQPVAGKDLIAAVREITGREFQCFFGGSGSSPALVGSRSMYPGAHVCVLALTEQGPSLIAPDEHYTRATIKGVEPREGGMEYPVGGDPLERQESKVHEVAEKLDKRFCL